MKIFYLMFNLCHQGGMENVLTKKVNYLSEVLGYDITIVTAHQKGRVPFFPLSPKVKTVDLGVNIHIKPLMPLYLHRLEKLSKRERPDIIMSMCYADLPYLPSLKDGSVKMAEFHFSYDSFAIRGKLKQRRSFERAIAKYRKFIVLTDEDKKKWDAFSDNVVRIYNPLTFNEQDGNRAALDVKRCIAAGRLVEQKNYPDMLKAWKIVNEKHPDWKLDIYGEGKAAPVLLNLAKELGIFDSVKINPPTSNLRKEFLGSSIYLMSSIYEGLPLVLLEAASVGLPAVSYSCPCGSSELIRDGKSGFLVEPGRFEEFASRINQLIEDKKTRESFGINACELSRNFSLEKIMPQWDELFEKNSAFKLQD